MEKTRPKPQFCNICKIEIKSTWKTHTKSKGHLFKKKSNTRVYVSGYKRTTTKTELLQYFSIYKNIQLILFKPTFSLIEFSSEKAMNDALVTNHFIGDKKLVVELYTPSKNNPKAEEFVKVEDILVKLSTCKNVQHQIQTFVEMVSLTEADMKHREDVCYVIVNTLREFYPQCQVHMFGSSANGFGMKGCDIDLLFEPSLQYFTFYEQGNFMKMDKEVDFSVSDVRLGMVTMQEVLDLPPNDQLKFVHKVWKGLQSFRSCFFIQARCPIVKFVDKLHQYQCDFSCTNKLVVYNTELLYLFGQTDHRVKPLMLILRYWAKITGVTRMGKLTSYAFSLLVIFYLQNISPSVVPSVIYLKNLPCQKRFAAGWDCSFCTDISLIGHSTNTDSVEQLLLGFFEFYTEFDFGYVVSVLYGHTLQREDFNELDREEEQNFSSSPLCLQDPLECSRNVTAFMKVDVLLLLKEATKSSLHSLKNLLYVQFEPKWGISSMLASGEVEKLLSVIPTSPEFKFPTTSVTFTLGFCKRLKNSLTNWRYNKGVFIRKIITSFTRIFEEVLHIETEITDRTNKFPVIQVKCNHLVDQSGTLNSKKAKYSEEMKVDRDVLEVREGDLIKEKNYGVDSVKIERDVNSNTLSKQLVQNNETKDLRTYGNVASVKIEKDAHSNNLNGPFSLNNASGIDSWASKSNVRKMEVFLKDCVLCPACTSNPSEFSITFEKSALQSKTPTKSNFQTPAESDSQTLAKSDLQTPTESDLQTPAKSDSQTPVKSDSQTPVKSDSQTPVKSDSQTPAKSDLQTPTERDRQTLAESDQQTLAESDQQTPAKSIPKIKTLPVLGTETSPKSAPEAKTPAQSKSSHLSDIELLVSMQNTVYFNVWYGRKKVKETLRTISNIFDLESSVSQCIIDSDQTKLSRPMSFTCDVLWPTNMKIDQFIVVLCPVDEHSSFTHFASFLEDFIVDLLIDALKL